MTVHMAPGPAPVRASGRILPPATSPIPRAPSPFVDASGPGIRPQGSALLEATVTGTRAPSPPVIVQRGRGGRKGGPKTVNLKRMGLSSDEREAVRNIKYDLSQARVAARSAAAPAAAAAAPAAAAAAPAAAAAAPAAAAAAAAAPAAAAAAAAAPAAAAAAPAAAAPARRLARVGPAGADFSNREGRLQGGRNDRSTLREYQLGQAREGDARPRGSRRAVVDVQDNQVHGLYVTKDHYNTFMKAT